MKIFSRSIFLCFFVLLLFITSSAQAAIELAIETNPGPVQPNESVDIQISVGNSGNSLSGTLVLEMVYPANLNAIADGTFIDGGDCNSTSCSTNEIVTWQLGAIPPGSTQTVTLPPIVTNGTANGTSIPFNVEVFENNIKVGDINRNVIVQNTPPFDIAMDEDVNPVMPGDPLVYTVTYSNRSSASSTNTSLNFPLPTGVSFVSATGGGVLNGNTVEWNLNTLPAHTGSEQKVTVNVGNAVVPGSFLELDNAEISGTVNFVSESSIASAVTAVSNNTSMTLAMELNPDPVQTNETLNTVLTVSNPTNGTLFGVVLELRYPAHLNAVFDGPHIDDGDCASTTCSVNEIVTWQLGTLPAGSSQTVTLPPIVTNGTIVGSLITFNARVRENNGTRAAQSRSVLVQNTPPFDIAVDEDVNPVAPGDPLVYTVTYSNRSSASATNTTLRFPLPPGVSFVSATGGGVLNGNTVVWNLNTLPAHTGSEQKVTVNVGNAVALGSVLQVDKAEISGTINFLQESANALAITTVGNNIPMTLAIELNPDPVQANETLRTALTVSNTGNAALFGVELELRYPTHLNAVFDGPHIDGGDCTSTSCSVNEIVTWQLGPLPAGSSQTVTLPPIVTNGTIEGSLITFNARVREDNGTRAAQSGTVLVQNTPPFDITVDEDVNPVMPGDPLVYTVTYSNRSLSSANNTTLSFPLPSGVNFVSATGGGVLNGNTVEWNLNTLLAQTGAEQKVNVTVGNAVVPGTVLEVDKAEISGTVNFLQQSSAALAVTTVSDFTPLLLAIDLNPDPVLPNQTLNTALTLTNSTSGALFGVELELRYPEHLNAVADGANIDGGDCASTTCSTNEIVTWQLVTLAANSSQTVTLPPIVTNGTLEGTLISFNANAFDGNNVQVVASDTAYVGDDFTPAPDDNDGDGVVDNLDNCINVPNGPNAGPNNQLDTDGDNFGNICDADLDNSGFVNSIDFSLFKQRLLSTDPDADLDGSGFVNSIDFSIFKTLLLSPPGPSGLVP